MKIIKKYLSVFLVVLMLISVFSVSTPVFAAEVNEQNTQKEYEDKLLGETVETDSLPTGVIGEVYEKRDEFSKTYKLVDGSFTTVISQMPLHSYENGEWKEINNTLEATDETIKNVDGTFDVLFPQTMAEDEKITVVNGGESLAFSVNGVENSTAVVEESQATDEIAEDLAQTVSGITYEEINPDTDVEYIVTPQFIKENIIVHNKESLKETYSFDIEKGDLVATFDSNNNLLFTNSKNEKVFEIPAPVMTDASGADSYDITVTAENTEKEVLTLTYTPSQEWLEASERAYPVTIDPVICVPSSNGAFIEDTVIRNGDNSETNFVNSENGFVCNTEENAEILVKFNMDAFDCFKAPSVVITDVDYVCSALFKTSSNVLLKEITTPWDVDTVTYNSVYSESGNNGFYGNEIIDSFIGLESTEQIAMYFNITELFKGWLSGEENNGFTLLPDENTETNVAVLLDATRTQGITTYTFNTVCCVNYVDTGGSSASQENLAQDVGRAGMVNINKFSRGLSLYRSDLTLGGRILPVDISFNYDAAYNRLKEILVNIYDLEEYSVNLCYGNKWVPSYIQAVLAFSDTSYQVYTGEGTVLDFNLTTTTEDDETVYEFEEPENQNSGYMLELVDSDSDPSFENIRLISPGGYATYFNEMGIATAIRESETEDGENSERIDIHYTDDFKIDYITDGIGRKYDFVYSETTGLLSEINCLSATNGQITGGTTNTPLKVSYAYDSNNNLTGVTYPDGESVAYTYDSAGNLTSVNSIDDYKINYTYDSLGKVTAASEYAGTTLGNTIQLTDLGNSQVKIADEFNGTQTYQFAKNGLLAYTFDDAGNYYKADNGLENDESVFSVSKWRIASENLLANGSFEEASFIDSTKAKNWSGTFERTTAPEPSKDSEGNVIGFDNSCFGDYACLVSSAGNQTNFVSQEVEVENTAAYTFSAYVKSVTEGSLTLRITAKDESGNTDEATQNIGYSASETVVSAEDWTQASVTYIPRSGFVPQSIKVEIGFADGSGSYYVDCAQLETGNGTACYNFIENGSFNLDSAWNETEVVSETINGKKVYASALGGGSAVLVQTGDSHTVSDNVSAITQNVKINGKKGDVYSIGGWYKGWFDDNLIHSEAQAQYASVNQQLTNGAAQIKVTYTYTKDVEAVDEATGLTETTQQSVTENFVVDFAPESHGWQYAVESFALKADVEAVDVTVIAKNVPEDSFVTGVELTLATDAVSFSLEDMKSAADEQTPDTDETEPTDICVCEQCEEIDCPCTCESEESCECVECKRQSGTVSLSDDGKTETTKSFDGESYMQSSVTYSDDFNFVVSETDENNVSTGYSYNIDGTLATVTDAAQKTTTYQSNAMGYLTLAKINATGLANNATELAISYVYDGDLLEKVQQGNVEYTYEYDGWGQVKKILVDGNPLISYNYGTKQNRGRVLSVVFGDTANEDFTVKYSYSGKTGEVTAVEKYIVVQGERDSITYSYEYDNLGNLRSIRDNGTGHKITYTENGLVITDASTNQIIYQIADVEVDASSEDGSEQPISITEETANGVSYTHNVYESDYNAETGKTTEYEAVVGGKTIGTQTVTDWFGRTESVTVMMKNPKDSLVTDYASISSQYGYKATGDITTNLVSSFNNTIGGENSGTVNYSYTYDSNGRIINASAVSGVQSLNGSSQYVYDEAGQLIREVSGSNTYEYTYDSKGNIVTRKMLTGETLVSTDSFVYGADTWEDRLTGLNNKTISYDEIGNPTSYLGANLSWRGRELVKYEKGNKEISYSYDVDGMRYRKVVKTNGVETARYDYVYSEGRLILLTYTSNGASNTARFIYDSLGEIRGFILDNTAAYLYLKNGQGDITGIVDESGSIILTYSYTAWGKVTYSATDMESMALAATLSNVNPFTYRGYCYDYDIGMYYLQSRYYDPDICRFINADSTDYLGATGTTLSYNLFAYCENDGVNYVDATGTWAYDVHAGYYEPSQKDKAKVKLRYVKGMNGKLIPYYISGKGKDETPIYYGTYYWAVKCGVNVNNAKAIAYYCNDVDRQYSPILGEYQSWHFNTNENDTSDSRIIISLVMCIEAHSYFEEALSYKKGTKKYKTAVEKGLIALGYALHPIQDMYAHTSDMCYRFPVPKTIYIKNLYGQIEARVTVVLGWSHLGSGADNEQKRLKQVEKTEKRTKAILNEFVKSYNSILSKDSGVRV